MLKRETLVELSREIEFRVNCMHLDRKSWDRACGQWLVYGFERSLGFGNAASLESVVENAWRSKLNIQEEVEKFLVDLYTAAGKL